MTEQKINKECVEQFAIIKTSLEFHQKWRDEQKISLDKIQKEIEFLTGNGNRGRIDAISDQLSDIQLMLTGHLAEASARDHRLDVHAGRIDKLEGRLYKVAIGSAALAAVLVPLANLLISKLL